LKTTHICKIQEIDEIASGIYNVMVICPEIAKIAEAGQFLHIDCGDGINNMLRRPISICDTTNDTVRFIFETKGSGTKWLSQRVAGNTLDIVGPVGNSFVISERYEKPVIIGGGIGVFPLYMLAKQLDNAQVLLGFRSIDRVVMEQEFATVSKSTTVATDDGSYGYQGYAVELLEKILQMGDADIIYSCGPAPMLKAVKLLAEKYKVKCQLSLEQRMGCGIGACLVCTCETTAQGMEKHKRVCKDGPIFWSDEIVLS